MISQSFDFFVNHKYKANSCPVNELSKLTIQDSLTLNPFHLPQNECSFVSLRDVQRLLDVANWFYKQRRYLFPAMDDNDDDELLLNQKSDAERERAAGPVCQSLTNKNVDNLQDC